MIVMIKFENGLKTYEYRIYKIFTMNVYLIKYSMNSYLRHMSDSIEYPLI